MKLIIKDGKFTITGDIEKDPQLSGSGKSLVLATTHGFIVAQDDKGEEVKLSINLIKKIKK